MTTNASDLVLVTGGGGFVGGAVVRRLLARGCRVRSISRGKYPHLARQGVDTIEASLEDSNAVLRACDGCGAVIHCAAKAGVWGPYDEFHRANVVGTRNLLDACRRASVPLLVFTSSPSVVFHGEDSEGADESLPYPRKYLSPYAQTKAEAEQLVLGSDSPGLRTVALRPHLVWGPGDPHLVPRVLARARSGRLRIIGPGKNRVDVTHIENAARAHMDALDTLQQHPGRAGGKAYFITNGEPVLLWDFINRVLSAANLRPVTRHVPLSVARMAATIFESVHRLFRLSGEPFLTTFVVEELARHHWFDITAAKRDLGYSPEVTISDGLTNLAAYFTQLTGSEHA